MTHAPHTRRIPHTSSRCNSGGITITREIQLTRTMKGRRKITAKPSPQMKPEPGRIPRISRLMALAIRYDRMLREGRVSSQSELARLVHVTQPRMTQIMNLLHLAPDIQEAILFLPCVFEGRDPITERDLRPITREIEWDKQHHLWLGHGQHSGQRNSTGHGQSQSPTCKP